MLAILDDLEMESTDVFRKIVYEIADGIVGIDLKGTIRLCNPAAEALFGWAPGSLLGKQIEVLLPQQYRAGHQKHVDAFANGEVDARYMGQRNAHTVGQHADGRVLPLGTTILRTQTDVGPMMIAVIRDLSERLDYQKELERLANTDPLSDIFNRRAFMQLAMAEIANGRAAGSPISVLLFDIDRFKAVNDNFGHAVGDAVIRDFTGLLRRSTRAGDLIARWGGEEFIVLLPKTTIEMAVSIAETVRAASETYGYSDDPRVQATVSCGATCCANATTGLEELVNRADMALYEAKAGGRNRIVAKHPVERPATA